MVYAHINKHNGVSRKCNKPDLGVFIVIYKSGGMPGDAASRVELATQQAAKAAAAGVID